MRSVKQKKVAVSLSGQPRFFEICGPQLKKYIEEKQYEADFFLHAWYSNDKYSASNWAPNVPPVSDLRNKLIRMYRPKRILIETVKDQLFKIQVSRLKKNTEAEPFIQASMLYSMSQASVLRNDYIEQTNTEYDLVIRTRYDYYPLKDDVGHLEGSSTSLHFPDLIRNKNVICDYWMHGKNEIVNVAEKSYFYMFKKSFLNRQKICGEEIITNTLKELGVSTQPYEALGGLVRDEMFEDKRFGKWS